MSKPVTGTASRSAALFFKSVITMAACSFVVLAGSQSAQAAPAQSARVDLSDLPELMSRMGQKRAAVAATENAVKAARASRLRSSRTIEGTASASISTRETISRGSALSERDITPNTPSDEREPVFSPNGDFIAFLSNRTSTGAAGTYYHVWIMNRDGSGQRQVTGLPNQNNVNRSQRRPTWSPDSNQLVYVDEVTAANPQLFVAAPLRDSDLTTPGIQVGIPEQRTFTTGLKRSPVFSPSGQELIYAAKVNPRTNTVVPSFDLFSIDATGSTTNSQRLTGGTTDPAGDAADDYNPVFSVVNPSVLYFSSNRAIVNGTATRLTAGRRIWVTQANGAEPRQVSDPTQRDNGKASDVDDYPTTSRAFADSGVFSNFDDSDSYERVAFQSNSLIDGTDTTPDLNIWSLKVDSNVYAPPPVNTTPQPQALLVGSYNRDSVVQFDSTTGAFQNIFADTGSFGHHVEGVTFGNDLNDDGVRDLLVAVRDNNNGGGSIDAFDGVDGTRLGTFARGGGTGNFVRPTGIYYDGFYVYVASGYNQSAPSSSGKVYRYLARNGLPAPAQGRTGAEFTDGKGVDLGTTTAPKLNGLEGVVIGPDVTNDGISDLFVSVLIDNKINVYDGQTGNLATTFTDGFITAGSSGLKLPTGITFNPDETLLYVSSSGSNEVLVFNVSDQSFVRSITGVNAPEGLTFGPDGNLYVADFASVTGTIGQGNRVNRFTPAGDAVPSSDQTGAVFATDTSLQGAGYLVFTPNSFGNGNGGNGGGYPPADSTVETNSGTTPVQAVLETNVYSSPGAYRTSGLTGSGNDADAATNQDKSADREPAYARSRSTGAISSQIAFASQRKKAFAPNSTIVNATGGAQTSIDANTPTHDIWITQSADLTPPILIPQAAGNQLYPVVAPGPQAPFASGRRRTYETGLAPGGTVDFALVLKETESGIATVSVSLYDANRPQFEGDGRITSKVNVGLDVTIAPERKAQAVSGFGDIALQAYDDGPIGVESQRTGVFGHERQANAVEGDGIYYCATSTPAPNYASDFYMDVTVQDKVGNTFTYDNIWGFTTRQFVKAGNTDLFVSDYTAGQRFAANFDPSGSFDDSFFNISGNPRFEDLDPVESYYLRNPGGEVTDKGDPNTDFDDRVITGASKTTFANVDVWRVQCRGQVPQSVMDSYEPTRTQQYDPEDFANGKPVDANGNPVDLATLPKDRQVAVSTSAIIWASPYTGLVFAGPGTLADSEMQRRLTNFLASGGRLFVSGSDVIYALSNGGTQPGTQPNQFLTNELNARWAGETGAELIKADVGAFGGDLQTYPRTVIPFDPNNTWADASSSGAQYGADVIGAAGTGATVTPAYKIGESVVGQRVLKDRGNGLESRLVFLSFNLDSVNRQYNNTPQLGIHAIDARARISSGVRRYFKTGGLSGTVVNNQTNLPIEGFVVQIVGSSGTYIAVTDSNGSYDILGLPEGGYTVQPALYTDAGVSKPVNTGFFPGPVRGTSVSGGSITTGVNFRVIPNPPGSLSGRAVLSDATPTVLTDNPPLANTPVLLRSKDRSQLFTGGGQYAQLTQTDAGGRYSFASVPTGIDLEVIFNPDVNDIPEESGLRDVYTGANPNYGRRIVPDTRRPGDIEVPIGDAYVLNDGSGDDAADSGVPIVVNSGVTITGSVVVKQNNVDKPLVGVTVKLLKSGTAIQTVTTDAQGIYIFDDIPVGSYVVEVTSDGTVKRVSISVPRTSTFTVPVIRFFIQSLSGKVVFDSSGQPAPGATIQVLKGTTVVKTVTADANGAYVISPIPAGTYTVSASKNGSIGTASVVVADGTNATAPTIRLKSQSASGFVRLFTTSTTTGAPAIGAKVVLKRNGVVVAGPVVTGSNGSYTITAPAAGTYDIEATYTNAENNVATSVPAQVTIETGVQKTGVELRIFMRPLAGTVTMNGVGTTASVSLFKVQANGTQTLLVTKTSAADGKYTFNAQPAGTYVVKATALGDTVSSANITITNTAGLITVPVLALKTQTISGIVTASGSPAASATVQLEQNQKILRTFTTLADGRFAFDKLLAGTYVVRAIKGGLRSADRTITVVRGSNPASVSLALVNQNVTGRVVSGGVGVAAATVQLLKSGVVVQTTTTNSTGGYSFGSLQAGTYEVRATKAGVAGSDTAKVSFTTPSTATAVTAPDIVLLFQTIVGKGTVNGTAAQGISVKLYKRNADGSKGTLAATVLTDSTGTYRFTTIGAGKYILEGSKDGISTEASIDITRTGQTVAGPTLALRFQTVTGRVTLNGSAAVGVTVTLKSSSGATKTTTTNSSGTYLFSGLIAGTYTVSASGSGFTDTDTVTVVSGSDATAPVLTLGTGTPPPLIEDFKPGRVYHFSVPYSDSTSPYVPTTVIKALSAAPKAADGTVNYVLKRFDAATQTYLSITDPNARIERGVGYVIEQVKTGTTVRIKRPTDDASRLPMTGDTFILTLKLNPSPGLSDNGVNLIGFPFDPEKYSHALWSETSFQVTGADGTTTTFANVEAAVAANVVSREMYTLSADGTSYVLTDRIEPFKAYFVQVRKDNVKATLKAKLR